VCYFLTIASPLTLSEIRSMLRTGLNADPASNTERAALIRLHRPARTVAHLLVGACSCDLVRTRQSTRIEDEREHRRRYGRQKLSRSEIIRQLERHRRGPDPRPIPPAGWASALQDFIVEHARNAGPTLYLLTFDPRSHPPARPLPDLAYRSVTEVRAGLDWLIEDQPVIVS
jgi:hypothetical protein